LIRSRVNRTVPSLGLVDQLSSEFQTSPVCTTFRIVSVSDDPCAVAGIRNGMVKWLFPSERLIEASCYPQKGEILSPFAKDRWNAFCQGESEKVTHEGLAGHWFSLYGKAAAVGDLSVQEHYLPVRFMDTIVVLLTVDDNEVFGFSSYQDEGDDDEDYGSWIKDRHDSGD
jgi:hypothetical protein